MGQRSEDLRDAAFELQRFARVYWIESRGMGETSAPVVELERLASVLRQTADNLDAFSNHELDNDL